MYILILYTKRCHVARIRQVPKLLLCHLDEIDAPTYTGQWRLACPSTGEAYRAVSSFP